MCFYKWLQTDANIVFCSYVLYCFYPWPYILNVQIWSHKTIDIFSVAIDVFLNLFWKICPLFMQILITCLKCFRASFFAFLLQRKHALETRLPMINLIFPTSLLFLFNVNVQCCAVPFIYITVLQEKSKWGNVVEGWVIIICFKILACLISGSFFELLFSLFLMEFIMTIINIYIIIITIVMVIFLFLLLFL